MEYKRSSRRGLKRGGNLAETARWKLLSLQALPMNICVLFALVPSDQGLGDLAGFSTLWSCELSHTVLFTERQLQAETLLSL